MKRRVNSSGGSHGRRRRLLIAGLGVGLAAGGLVAGRARTTGDRPAVSLPEVVPDSPIHRGGAGSPLLLLHGFSVTWRTWKPVFAELERHHDVIAPTMLGHSGGAAFGAGVPPSIDALVDGVEAELDRLGLDTVHIAGNSMGGWVALELARRGRARSVVAFSPAGAWNSAPRMAMLVAGFRVAIAGMTVFGHRAERLALTPNGRRWLAGHQCEHPERLDPAELIADIRAIKASPVLRTIVSGLSETPFRPLPSPGCPVRVVWAQRDRVIPFEYYGAPLMDRLPTAELVKLDGVGHVPMTDDPGAVARLILDVTTRERVVKLHRERDRPDSGTRRW